MLCRFAVLSAGVALLVMIYYSSVEAAAPAGSELPPARSLLEADPAEQAVQRWEQVQRPRLVERLQEAAAPALRIEVRTPAPEPGLLGARCQEIVLRDASQSAAWQVWIPEEHLGRGPAVLLLGVGPTPDARRSLTQALLDEGWIVMTPAADALAAADQLPPDRPALRRFDRAAFATLAERRDVDPERLAVLGFDLQTPRALPLSAAAPAAAAIVETCPAAAAGPVDRDTLAALAAPRPLYVCVDANAGDPTPAGLARRTYGLYGLSELYREAPSAETLGWEATAASVVQWLQDEL